MSLTTESRHKEEMEGVAELAFLRSIPVSKKNKQQQDQHQQLRQQRDRKADEKPEQRVFPRTWESTTDDKADGFTVTTYNILSDLCMSDGYLYCPADERYMTARHPRIMAEVMHMKPDVLCLQEVDAEHFHQRLLPDLIGLGYESVHYLRDDHLGLAVSFKSSVFEMLEHRPRVLHRVAEKYIKVGGLK